MASIIDICNLALTHLGDEATVSSIDPVDGSAQAAYCRTYYPFCVDNMLSLHEWNFTLKKQQLALLAETSTVWLYVYALPSDYLKVIYIYGDDVVDESLTVSDGYIHEQRSVNNQQDFVIMQNAAGLASLYTNTKNAVVTYTARVVDPMQFPPLFTEALSYYLASRLANVIYKGVTGIKVSEAMMQHFGQSLTMAKNIDANQRQTTEQLLPVWINNR